MSAVNSILNDLANHADEQGWTEISKIARESLEQLPSGAWLVAPVGVDLAAFRAWIVSVCPDCQVTEESLESLAKRPLALLAAPRAIATLASNRQVEAEAATAVAHSFLGRPPETFAIVFLMDDPLPDRETVTRLERGAWRLFVPGQSGDWRGQPLRDHRIFLWSESASDLELKQRCTQDRDALRAWLQTPSQNDTFANQRCLALIAAAEERLATDQPVAPSVSSTLPRLRTTREDLATLRRRLVGLLDREAPIVRQQVVVELQTLEQDLIRDLRSHLEAALPLVGGALDGAMVARHIDDYIQAGFNRWSRRATGLANSSSHTLASDVEDLLTGLDWSLVNQATVATGEAALPAALVQLIANQPQQPLAPSGAAVGETNPLVLPDNRFGSLVRIGIAGALVGAASVAFLPVAGLAGAAVAGTLGALGGGVVDRALRRSDLIRAGEEYGSAAIRHQARQATDAISGGAPEVVRPLREHVTDLLRRAEAAMDAAIQRGANDEALAPLSSSSAVLEELRSRALAELIPGAS